MDFLKRSISVQFILLASIFIFIATFSMGTLSYHVASEAIVEKLKLSDLEKIIDLKAELINQRLKRARETSLLLSDDPVVVEWAKNGEKNKQLNIVLEKMKFIRKNFDYSHVDVVSEKTRTVYQFLEKENLSTYKIEEKNPRDSWYFRIKNNNQKLELKIERNPMFKQYYIFINALIMEKGKFLGKAGTAIDFTTIANEFTKEDNFRGKSWLINQAGIVELSDNENEIGKSVEEVFSSHKIKEKAKIQNKITIFEGENKNGERMFYAMKSLAENNWIIVYEVSYDIIIKPLLTIKFIAYFGGIIFLFLVAIIYYFVTENITRPIKELIEIAQKVTKGDLSQKYETKLINEVGLLANAFNQMTESMKQNLRLISEFVEENTEAQTKIEVARKIQTSLIPKKPELEGFEITGYMKTAEEVGGDYYDIIITPNGSFALIGDVSGHGVTAGLFMMMAQTSIHSIILANPDKPPSWILARVNKILKNNIFLLDEFRFMSMQLLHFDKKSNIIYAGAHEDILVFRNKTKKVDEYKSPGFWLGIETEIESFLIDSKIKINKNDVILLFTDGVTEARVPGKKIFFSKEKLVGILEKSGELSTNEIRNNILKELKDYEQKDDITFLILKKT